MTKDVYPDNDINFLAILMNGNFYGMEQDYYSNQYDGLYTPIVDSTNQKLTNIVSLDDNSINPFVGDGLNSMVIKKVAYNCIASDS